MSLGLVVALGLGLAVAVGAVAVRPAMSSSQFPGRKVAPTQAGAHGPWGQLEVTPIQIEPPSELVAMLPPDTGYVFPVSPRLLDSLPASGLTSPTIARLKDHLRGVGPWRLLRDLPFLMTSLPSAEEKTRFGTVILSADSHLVRLKVEATTDVAALLRYWRPSGNADDIAPLVRSLARVEGGASIDLVRILPSFAASHVNRYPRRADPTEVRADCFWTSFNFFAATATQPNDDPKRVVNEFKSRFRPVTSMPTLGNLVVLLDAKGAPVHAAVYIADDLVFTKNGLGVLSPWTYMKSQSMIDMYTSLMGKLRVVYVAELSAATI